MFVIVGARLEDHHVGALELGRVGGQADLQAGVDHRPHSLREHRRQPMVEQPAAIHQPRLDRALGVDRDDRIDADHQLGPRLQRHRGVHGLEQDAVDVVAPLDLHRRIEAGEGRAGGDGERDRDVVQPRLAEPHRLAGVEVRGHHHQALAELAEVVRPPLDVEDLLYVLADRLVVEDPYRQGLAEAGQRFEQGEVPAVGDPLPDRLPEQPRHGAAAALDLADGRGEEGLGHERMLPRLVRDDRPAHLGGGEVVGEVGADDRARAHPDVDEQVVEIETVDRFVESPEGADLVDRPLRSPRRERQSDPGGAVLAVRVTFGLLHQTHPSP
jgi:hypothetical protein